VKVDSNGDREPDYWLWDMQKSESKFEVVIEARMTSSDYQVQMYSLKIAKIDM